MTDDISKEPSEEVDENQLSMARTLGSSYRDAVGYMATRVAHTGDTTEAGDYVVGFAQEEAEGMYELVEEGEFEWVDPDEEKNCHLEVVVMDAADGRFVPYTDVTATFEGEGGEHGPFELPFLWHPGLNHYGANVELPGSGTYDIRVAVDPPTFKRHDETNGDRYGESVTVTFEGVDVEAGRD
jgi:hypothetical protein